MDPKPTTVKKNKGAELDLQLPGVYVICGLQGGGKSWLIKYMMACVGDTFDVVLVFSNTAFAEGNFDYIADPDYVHREYKEDVLRGMMDIFEEQITAGRPLKGCVIFDDCITGKQWMSEALVSLVTQVRHYNITLILSTQYPKYIRPIFHTNAFRVFMFNMGSLIALKALWEAYGQLFSFDEFKAYFMEATGPKHQFLSYDMKNGATSIEGRYRVLLCPAEIPKFKVGVKKAKKAGKGKAVKVVL